VPPPPGQTRFPSSGFRSQLRPQALHPAPRVRAAAVRIFLSFTPAARHGSVFLPKRVFSCAATVHRVFFSRVRVRTFDFFSKRRRSVCSSVPRAAVPRTHRRPGAVLESARVPRRHADCLLFNRATAGPGSSLPSFLSGARVCAAGWVPDLSSVG
jgi:hypothetical protein